jgi:surface carbohydrate biosynthesis protein
MFNSKKIALQGGEVKKDFLKSGVEEGRLVVTGAPVYDFIRDSVRIRKEINNFKYLEKYGIDLKKGLIVFASQPHDKKLYKIEEKRRILTGLKMAMANFPDSTLVVKLHPYESYEELANSILEKDFDKNIVVVKDINIFDLIYICDLLITRYSTSALEAILLDKPVMTINLGGAPDLFPYADNNVALGVYREEDITPSLRRILYDRNTKEKLKENRPKFIEKYAYRLDGNATDRILSLIQEMMTN